MAEVEMQVPGALKENFGGHVRLGRKCSVSIFDWDDTLFASSHIAEMERENRLMELEENGYLDALQRTAIGLLRVASKISRVLIVTNANMAWVTEVLEKWMPRVAEFIVQNSIMVLSARDIHEVVHPEAPSLWKLRTFRDILSVSKSINGEVQNLIIVGDGEEEMEAGDHLRNSEANCTVKRVKVPNHLPMDQLARQLALLTMSFRNVWSSDRALDIGF